MDVRYGLGSLAFSRRGEELKRHSDVCEKKVDLADRCIYLSHRKGPGCRPVRARVRIRVHRGLTGGERLPDGVEVPLRLRQPFVEVDRMTPFALLGRGSDLARPVRSLDQTMVSTDLTTHVHPR